MINNQYPMGMIWHNYKISQFDIGELFGDFQLLLFYSDRKKAVITAKKKFIIARLGDATLLIAILRIIC
jgi:hypothetical protein